MRISHQELIANVLCDQTEIPASDLTSVRLLFGDYRIERTLQISDFVHECSKTTLRAATVKKTAKGTGIVRYAPWFKHSVPIFDELMIDPNDLKPFELCAEVKSFMQAQDDMDSPPSTYGLFENLKSASFDYLKSRVDVLNTFVESIRKQLNTPEVKQAIQQRMKQSQENLASCKHLVNKLFMKYSALTVLRIDFAYKPKHEDMLNPELADLDEGELHAPHQLELLKEQVHQFLNNRRCNKILKKIIAYIVKFEHGIRKGYHAHLILFLNGKKYSNDSYYATYCTKYWVKLTNGKGCTYNCNLSKNKYRKLGIGLINYHDKEKRDNLMICLQYLCKAEQFFIFKRLGAAKFKRLQKSLAPVIIEGKAKAGRPRKYKGC